MKRKRIIIGVLALVGLALLLLFGGIVRRLQTLQSDQLAAARWGDDAVQISCYVSSYAGLYADGIVSLEEAISNSLQNDFSAAETDSTWYDAYSCDGGNVSALGAKTGKKTLQMTLVSETYFQMHPYTLLSGNRLSEADTSTNRVVLDEAAAWNLFGGIDVAGMTVTFENRICEVAGVIRLPDDFASAQATENDLPGIYMLYSDYLAGLNADGGEQEPAITCYEVVLPELVENYGYSLMEEIFESVSASWNGEEGITDNSDSTQTTVRSDYRLVQNTDRFSLVQVWDYLFHHTDYITRTEAIAYPASENAALILLHRIAMLTIGAFLGLVLLLAAVTAAIVTDRKTIAAKFLHLKAWAATKAMIKAMK